MGVNDIEELDNTQYTAHYWRTSSKAELLIITFFPSLQTILIVVWSANGDSNALTSEASHNLLNDDTCRCVCASNSVRQIE